MKKNILFLILCFLFFALSACAERENSDIEGRFREVKSVLKEELSPYQDFSEQYGTLYDLCTDTYGDVYFLYINEKTDNRECNIIQFHKEEDTYELLTMHPKDNPAICFIRVDPEGNILLFDTSRAYLLKRDEDFSDTDFPAWPHGGVLFPGDGTVICQIYTDSPYYIFDLHTGEKMGIYLEKDFLFSNGSCQPFLDGTYGKELLITSTGIHEHAENLWLLKVPSDRTSLSKTGFLAKKVEKLQEDGNDIYCVRDAGYQYRYYWEEVDSDIKTVTLKVTAWQDRATLRTALADYEISNPNINIDYNFRCIDLPENAQEMNILLQQTNAEISSAQAADIYVLDNLPWERYKDNGYLMDLSDIVQPYTADGDYFGNVMTAYKEEEAVYAVPWFFSADFAVCTDEMAPYVKDIHSLSSYLESHPEAPGLVPYYFKNHPDIFLAQIFRHPDYTAVPAGGIHAKFLFGIHAASKEKEAAADLLRYLFSYFETHGKSDPAISTFVFLPGLPIYKQALEDRLLSQGSFADSKDFYTIPIFDKEFPIYYSTRQETDQIIEWLGLFEHPVPGAHPLSNAVYAILEERSRGYLTGEQSLEDVVTNIYNGLSLLYSEKQ